MTMLVLLTSGTGLILLGLTHWRVNMGRCALVSAYSWFFGLQMIFIAGLVVSADVNSDFDVMYLGITFAGLSLSAMGAAVANRVKRCSVRRESAAYQAMSADDDLTTGARPIVVILLATLCLVVGFTFVSRIGYNALLEGLRSISESGSPQRDQYSFLRRGATRDSYVAAGYAVQFTAVLLPSICYVLIVYGYQRQRQWLRRIALSLLAVDIYLVSATGGRKYVLQSLLLLSMVLLSMFSRRSRTGKRAGRFVIVVFVMSGALFLGATYVQGRLTAESFSPITLVDSVWNRLGGEYSSYQLMASRRLHPESPVFGAEWYATSRELLPGATRQDLPFDQRVHGLLFNGNTNGNVPLNIWGSLYYNWGFIGPCLGGFIVGYLLQSYHIRFILRRPKRVFSGTLLLVAGYHLALVRDPYSLFLEGGPTLILVCYLYRLMTTRRVGRLAPLTSTGTLRPARSRTPPVPVSPLPGQAH